MHSVYVLSQLLVSLFFIAVPINTENFNFFLRLLGTYALPDINALALRSLLVMTVLPDINKQA